MFSAVVKAVTGTKLSADVVVDYFDDRFPSQAAWKRINTVTYENVPLSTAAERQAFKALIDAQLQQMKAGEEDAALQSYVGTVISSI